MHSWLKINVRITTGVCSNQCVLHENYLNMETPKFPKPNYYCLQVAFLALLATLCLSACIPINRTKFAPSLVNAVPASFVNTGTELLIVPVVYHHLVIHVTDSNYHILKSPIFANADDIPLIHDQLTTSAYGYFAMTGTVHGVEENLTYLIIFSDQGEILVLRNRFRSWEQTSQISINKEMAESLTHALLSKNEINANLLLQVPELSGELRVEWQKQTRQAVINFIQHGLQTHTLQNQPQWLNSHHWHRRNCIISINIVLTLIRLLQNH